MFYAEWENKHQTNHGSTKWALARFRSKQSRDEWCERVNRIIGENVWNPITVRRARPRYNLQDFASAERCHEIMHTRDDCGHIVFFVDARR